MSTTERIVTFVALFISCLALTVSIVQTRIMQKQSHAAVWPRMDILDSSGAEHFELYVANQGVGPAIISDLEYKYKDTSFYVFSELFVHLARLKAKKDNRTEDLPFGFTYAEIVKGRVFKPFESIKIYTARDSFFIQLGHEYLDDVKFRFDYCSIYEKCWRMQDDEFIELD